MLLLFTVGMTLCGFAQEIKFEITEHDFGIVDYNAPAVYDFVFTNTGTEPLIVQKPKSSCGCTIPSWPKDPIMPGKQNKVSVTYRTNKVGKINQTVTVTSNAKNSPEIRLRIKGNVLTEGEIKPSQKNGRWGLEDNDGNVIIPFEYDEIKFAEKETFNVRKNGKWGIINKAGIIIIPFEYEEIKIDKKNNFNVKKKGKWGIVNKAGVIIIPCEYDEIKLDMYNKDGFNVKKNGKWGFIDETGVVIIPCEYEEIEVGFNRNYSQINSFQLKRNGKWGIADKTTGRIVIPCEYDDIFGFAETMPVKKGGKWGVIDDKNTVIIPCEYDEKFTFAETMQLKKGGKWGILDDKNKVIIPFVYDSIASHPINKTVLFAKKNGRWGLIDTKNKAITKFFAEEFGVTTQTKVLFKMPAETNDPKLKAFAGKWGAIATNGKLLFAPVLDENQYFIIMMRQLGQIKSAMDSGSAVDLESEWDKKFEEEMKKWDGENREALLKAIQE